MAELFIVTAAPNGYPNEVEPRPFTTLPLAVAELVDSINADIAHENIGGDATDEDGAGVQRIRELLATGTLENAQTALRIWNDITDDCCNGSDAVNKYHLAVAVLDRVEEVTS